MKQRSTTPAVSHKLASRVFMMALAILMLGAGLFQVPISSVSARDYDAEIRGLERDAQRYRNEVSRLSDEAATLQTQLNTISSQIAGIRTEMSINQAKHDKLVGDIEQNDKLIERNRETLGEILADLYIDDQITPLELLASSETIGDYIDKQENRSALRQGLSDKIKEIKALQKKLEEDRLSVQRVIDEQKTQQELLARSEAEQSSLLEKTKGDEAAYQALVQSKEDAMANVRAQQEAAAAALNRNGGSTGGRTTSTNYEYKDWATNYNNYCNYPNGTSGADRYGYCVRQCTSYVAWKLDSTGNNGAYRNLGHAHSWYNRGSTVSAGDVQRGDVVVLIGGPYGHVMYVEGVSGGVISYTDYNGAGGAVSPGQGTIPVSTATSYPYKVIRF